jgi:hypothetical protein
VQVKVAPEAGAPQLQPVALRAGESRLDGIVTVLVTVPAVARFPWLTTDVVMVAAPFGCHTPGEIEL